MSIHIGVAGTVFVDCKGFAAAKYVPLGRNVGSVKFVHGGVGRNVAENIARMGIPVSLLSSIDQGGIGQDVACRLTAAGVDIAFLAEMPECGMGMWLAVMDEQGELAGSISQMPDLQGMSDMLACRGREWMKRATHIALELDLNETLARQVLQLAWEERRPVYGLPGNLEVVLASADVLNGLDCVICNHIEIGRICGREFCEEDPPSVLRSLPDFAAQHRLQSVVVTLGAQGCVYLDAKSGEAGVQQALKVAVVDTCGAGDAFFSGTVAALARGKSLSQAVGLGTRVAACTIQSTENNCFSLSQELAKIKTGC